MSGLLEDIAARLERIELKLGKCDAPLGGYTDQKHSPLGPRKHCAAVRRRVAAGDTGAAIIGRHFLLSPDALRDEMRIESLPANGNAPVTESDAEDDAFYQQLMKDVGK